MKAGAEYSYDSTACCRSFKSGGAL